MTSPRLSRRLVLAACAFAALAGAASAHHGWRWTESGDFELTGLVETARLGNPHGVLTVNADGEIWTVEIGQPWRNARAGLEDDMLAPGVEIVATGRRSADAEEKLMKATALRIGDRTFVLYEGRV